MAKDLLGSKYPEGLESSLGSRTRRKQSDSLSKQDLGPIRPELDGAEMVAVSVSHNATIDGKYSNQFTAFDRFGYGKAFDAAGDQDGTIVAQVCDKAGNSDRSAISPLAAVTKFVKSNAVSRFFMPKTDFVEKHQKTFSALGSGDTEYKAQGVYVQFINSSEGHSTGMGASVRRHDNDPRAGHLRHGEPGQRRDRNPRGFSGIGFCRVKNSDAQKVLQKHFLGRFLQHQLRR
jgi:hypothetical protein